MAFYIRRGRDGVELWLKRVTPYVTWGPREQAKRFGSRREALTATHIAARGLNEPVSVVGEEPAGDQPKF